MEMSTEPKTLRAGDTWSWTITEADYSDYALTYYLRNASWKVNISATASGYEYTVSVSAATTTEYRPGKYHWIRRVTGDDGTFTTAEGDLEILPNLALGFLVDSRTFARTCLDNIEAYLADPNNITASSYSIGGRSLSRWSRSELLTERDKFIGEVRTEEDKARMAQGKGNPRRLYVRFDR
jgi:hypothetical protein